MMPEWLASTGSDKSCAEAAALLESALAGPVALGTGIRDIGGALGTAGFAEAVSNRMRSSA